jgi:hypothetical protein
MDRGRTDREFERGFGLRERRAGVTVDFEKAGRKMVLESFVEAG